MKNNRTFKLIFTAIMSALIIIMTLTGIGYIPVGPFKLTFNTLPVAIGAMVCGTLSGTILGLVFGLTSFSLAIFGMDALGVIVMSLGWKQAIFLFVTCVVPRILCGLIPGLLGEFIQKRNLSTKSDFVLASVGCGLTAIVNTIFFLLFFWIFFAHDLVTSSKLIELFGEKVNSFGLLFLIFAGWNALIEVLINLFLGTAIVKAIQKQRIR